MSDQRLREFERHWRDTGSLQDEAAYLRERLRVGDLSQDQVELAAYCGHEAARRLSLADWTERTVSNGDQRVEDLQSLIDWLKGLGRWGPRVCAQVAHEVAKEAYKLHETRLPEQVATELQALRAWAIALGPLPISASGDDWWPLRHLANRRDLPAGAFDAFCSIESAIAILRHDDDLEGVGDSLAHSCLAARDAMVTARLALPIQGWDCADPLHSKEATAGMIMLVERTGQRIGLGHRGQGFVELA